MKAVRVNRFGGSEVLQIEEIPTPQPAVNEILVKVRAAGMNPVDVIIVSGNASWLPLTLPLTPGCDISGVVTEVGSAVSQFKVGDEVYGFTELTRNGGYAEFTLALENEIAIKPKNVSFTEAASLPVVVLTAWQSLVQHANLKAGQRLLIHGASGGVGTVAIQIAKAKGAYVIATASAKNLALLRELGADEAIDYNASPFEKALEAVDVVFDLVGGDTTDRSFQVLKPGGFLVSIVGDPSKELAKQKGVEVAHVLCQPSKSQLEEIAKLVEDGKLKPVVDQVYAFADVRTAFESVATRRSRGKIVLEI